MFDIFVYLFESYVHANAYPEADELTLALANAGFDDAAINDALDWLAGLSHVDDPPLPRHAPSKDSFRIFTTAETDHLNSECRAFIAFLENLKVLDAGSRELVIERAMALEGLDITLTRLKVVVSMVLWRQASLTDRLISDELLIDNDKGDGLLH
jgi:Smg protein